MSTRNKIIVIILALLIAAAAFFLLRKPKVFSPAETPAPADPTSGNGIPRTSVTDSFPLQLGATGPNVRYLQNALNKIRPANKLVVDGVLGSNTRTALLLTVDTKRSAIPVTQTNFNSILAQANKV